MDTVSLQEYKQAFVELPDVEKRAAYLRDIIKRFEAQYAAPASPISKKSMQGVRIPYNLQTVYGILKGRGGPMRLREIAAEHDLTTAGTHAQLTALKRLKVVEQIDRGIYRAL